jgi:broad specificity phosphatase PhoE
MIALLHPGEEVAAVSHAAMLRLVVAEFSGLPRAQWRHELPNGSVTVFEVNGADITLLDLPVAA